VFETISQCPAASSRLIMAVIIRRGGAVYHAYDRLGVSSGAAKRTGMSEVVQSTPMREALVSFLMPTATGTVCPL
jgi:hypothetical protein